jgi:hypothetical protein
MVCLTVALACRSSQGLLVGLCPGFASRPDPLSPEADAVDAVEGAGDAAAGVDSPGHAALQVQKQKNLIKKSQNSSYPFLDSQ